MMRLGYMVGHALNDTVEVLEELRDVFLWTFFFLVLFAVIRAWLTGNFLLYDRNASVIAEAEKIIQDKAKAEAEALAQKIMEAAKQPPAKQGDCGCDEASIDVERL